MSLPVYTQYLPEDHPDYTPPSQCDCSWIYKVKTNHHQPSSNDKNAQSEKKGNQESQK